MLNFDDICSFHDKGLSLIYLPTKSKNPKGAEYIGWTTRANYTKEELKYLFDENKNLAVRLGSHSKLDSYYCLVAIDFDIKPEATIEQKQEITNQLVKLLGNPKNYPAVKSGSHNGSMHFYARCPIDSVPNDIQIFKAPWGEIVLKAQGSLIVLPPSIHPTSGKSYEWIRHFDKFYLTNIETTNIWEQVQNHYKYDSSPIDRLILTDETNLDSLNLHNNIKKLIKNGHDSDKYATRSESLFVCILALVEKGLSDDAIIEILTDTENAISECPLERGQGSIELAGKWLLPQIANAIKYRLEKAKEDFSDFLEPLRDKTEKKTNKFEDVVTLNFSTIQTLDDIKRHPHSRWIIPGRFLEKQITITAAPGGSGKSAYSLQEAISIALNKPLGVGTIRRPGNVLVYNTEDDMDEVLRRTYAICKHFKIQPKELNGKLFIANTTNNSRLVLVSLDSNKQVQLNKDNALHLKEQIVKNNISLCIIDPLVKFHAVNENDNSAMDFLASLFTTLSQQTNVAFNLIHHTKKPSNGLSSAGEADAIRGASALVNAARIAHTFTGMSKKDAENLGIEVKQRKRFVRLDSAKQNLFLDLDEASWFEKASVCLENDPNQIESDWRCVFLPWNEPTLLIEGVTIKIADDILHLIGSRQDSGNPLVSNPSHVDYLNTLLEDHFNLSLEHIKNLLNHWKNTGAVELIEIDGNKRIKAYCISDKNL